MKWSGIGHQKQKAYFEKLIAMGGLSHAYLFAGPEGVGKRGVAEDIVQTLVPAGYELDTMRLAPIRDRESGKITDIPIETVRELRSWLALRPLGQHKAILIDDAERLGQEAANTLLKVLEEPPAYAYFFLISGKPEQIISTIASRCERMDFHLITKDEMAMVLQDRKLDADDLQLVSVVARGKPGVALRLWEEKKLPTVARCIAEFTATLKGNLAQKIVYAKKLADDESASDIVSWWLAWTRAQLQERPQLAPVARGLLDLANVLAEPQYNRRLALEHFFLTNTVQR